MCWRAWSWRQHASCCMLRMLLQLAYLAADELAASCAVARLRMLRSERRDAQRACGYRVSHLSCACAEHEMSRCQDRTGTGTGTGACTHGVVPRTAVRAQTCVPTCDELIMICTELRYDPQFRPFPFSCAGACVCCFTSTTYTIQLINIHAKRRGDRRCICLCFVYTL